MSQKLTKLLLEWYEVHGRALPWRVKGCAHPDPYVILISEFMLQQTGVKTVIPYFARFMERFPTVYALAEASLEDVYLYWQGLGYYTRARSLHITAKMIVMELGGKFPRTLAEVLKLKGIGSYTAASFLAFAFNSPTTVIDGNVMRVICRMYHLTEPVSTLKETIHLRAEALTDKNRPGDYASAIMDLGALICTPRNPQCLLCPWQDYCLSKGMSGLDKIPLRGRPEKKLKEGNVYLITNRNNEIFMRKKEGQGLLSGLYELPWSEETLFPALQPQDSSRQISHVFTHFKLILRVFTLQAEDPGCAGEFVPLSELKNYPISTLMKKVLKTHINNPS